MTDYNAIRPILRTEDDHRAAAKWRTIESLREPQDLAAGLPPSLGGFRPETITNVVAGIVGGFFGATILPRLLKAQAPQPTPRRRRRAKRS